MQPFLQRTRGALQISKGVKRVNLQISLEVKEWSYWYRYGYTRILIYLVAVTWGLITNACYKDINLEALLSIAQDCLVPWRSIKNENAPGHRITPCRQRRPSAATSERSFRISCGCAASLLCHLDKSLLWGSCMPWTSYHTCHNASATAHNSSTRVPCS